MSTHNRPRVLISGAGIARLAAALRFRQIGWEPLVVEQAPSRRSNGYLINISPAGHEAAQRLGILPALEKQHVDLREFVYVNAGGRCKFAVPQAPSPSVPPRSPGGCRPAASSGSATSRSQPANTSPARSSPSGSTPPCCRCSSPASSSAPCPAATPRRSSDSEPTDPTSPNDDPHPTRSLLNGRGSAIVVDPGEQADSIVRARGYARADSLV